MLLSLAWQIWQREDNRNQAITYTFLSSFVSSPALQHPALRIKDSAKPQSLGGWKHKPTGLFPLQLQNEERKSLLCCNLYCYLRSYLTMSWSQLNLLSSCLESLDSGSKIHEVDGKYIASLWGAYYCFVNSFSDKERGFTIVTPPAIKQCLDKECYNSASDMLHILADDTKEAMANIRNSSKGRNPSLQPR